MPAKVTHHAGPTATHKPLAGVKTPPKPRGKAHEGAPPPPSVIRATGEDSKARPDHHVIKFLGEGGFARVYEVQNAANYTSFAAKVVNKQAISTMKNKTKLYAEIKIHRALHHPNIVKFVDCFEDEQNVYLLLEICRQGSLMEHLRRRGHFTPPEARFYLSQLIGAVLYIHNHRVIHRDLKLGNLFLDEQMNLKVGDFGLAALLNSDDERKKTICGTPNYIAPEVLFDRKNGHSYEVDVWSIGIILYTFLIGKPPFQTKDIDVICKRIKANDYSFPVTPVTSLAAQELIGFMLSSKPEERPSLTSVLEDKFFAHPFPASIPPEASNIIPSFRHLREDESLNNLKRMKQQMGIHMTKPLDIGKPKGVISTSAAVQAREFAKAVQPGSPISSLLKSAQEPLVYAREGSGPLQEINKRMSRMNIEEPAKNTDGDASNPVQFKDEVLRQQKLRLAKEMTKPSGLRNSRTATETLSKANPQKPLQPTKNGAFDTMLTNLTNAFTAYKTDSLASLSLNIGIEIVAPKVFIVSWLDYCNKYGMGYAMTDGTVGVHFNDGSTMVLSATKSHFDYISHKTITTTNENQVPVTSSHPTQLIRRNYPINSPQEELKTKVYLLRHFESYMLNKLYGDRPYTYIDQETTKGMNFVQKYLRTESVIMFKLTGDVLQFNFNDHTKILLATAAQIVTFIDEEYSMTTWSLAKLFKEAKVNSKSNLNNDCESTSEAVVSRLKVCRDLLMQIVGKSSTKNVKDVRNSVRKGQENQVPNAVRS